MDGFQTVIGVVGDVKHNGLDDGATPAVYVTMAQRPDSGFTIAVRTGVDPESLVPAIRQAVKAVDPDRPMTQVRTMTQMMAASVGARRLSLNLVSGFALIGLLLATTGIYGVVSHATQQRSREFGIRLALGAERGSVLRLVLRHGCVLALVGVAIGVTGALAMGDIIRAELFGIDPSDPVTLAAVCGGLAIVTLAASYVPARRAVRVNPASVLRE
jgi:ABC-type antimicrobial peptide transport system permease subunit